MRRGANMGRKAWRRLFFGRWQLVLIALALFAVVGASAAIVAFTEERLQASVEPRSETRLAACLTDNMVANLAGEGEQVIERACEAWVRDQNSPVAACVFRQRDSMTEADAPEAIAKRCGIALEEP